MLFTTPTLSRFSVLHISSAIVHHSKHRNANTFKPQRYQRHLPTAPPVLIRGTCEEASSQPVLDRNPCACARAPASTWLRSYRPQDLETSQDGEHCVGDKGRNQTSRLSSIFFLSFEQCLHVECRGIASYLFDLLQFSACYP